jgi:hypothetical protein
MHNHRRDEFGIARWYAELPIARFARAPCFFIFIQSDCVNIQQV